MRRAAAVKQLRVEFAGKSDRESIENEGELVGRGGLGANGSGTCDCTIQRLL